MRYAVSDELAGLAGTTAGCGDVLREWRWRGTGP